MINKLSDHYPEEIIRKHKIEELTSGFIFMVRSIVDNAGSEAQAIERTGNLAYNFAKEYDLITGEKGNG